MSKGLSLHIGVNKVNETIYNYRIPQLHNCDKDAKIMSKIAFNNGFITAHLLNEDATTENFLTGLADARNYLENGDIFLITFSGHGLLGFDKDAPQRDYRQSSWVMYDNLISSTILCQELKKFRNRVRIVIISDCCHSEYISKSVSTESASILFLASCAWHQVSSAGKQIGHSLFTHHIANVLQNKSPISYSALFSFVSARMPQFSQPKLFRAGINSDIFWKQKAFSIKNQVE